MLFQSMQIQLLISSSYLITIWQINDLVINLLFSWCTPLELFISTNQIHFIFIPQDQITIFHQQLFCQFYWHSQLTYQLYTVSQSICCSCNQHSSIFKVKCGLETQIFCNLCTKTIHATWRTWNRRTGGQWSRTKPQPESTSTKIKNKTNRTFFSFDF